MSPEDEWLQSELKRDREARAFREMLEPDDRIRRVRGHTENQSDWWIIGIVVLVIIASLFA